MLLFFYFESYRTIMKSFETPLNYHCQRMQSEYVNVIMYIVVADKVYRTVTQIVGAHRILVTAVNRIAFAGRMFM